MLLNLWPWTGWAYLLLAYIILKLGLGAMTACFMTKTKSVLLGWCLHSSSSGVGELKIFCENDEVLCNKSDSCVVNRHRLLSQNWIISDKTFRYSVNIQTISRTTILISFISFRVMWSWQTTFKIKSIFILSIYPLHHKINWLLIKREHHTDLNLIYVPKYPIDVMLSSRQINIFHFKFSFSIMCSFLVLS